MFAGDGNAPIVGVEVNDLLVPTTGAWFGATIPSIGPNGVNTGFTPNIQPNLTGGGALQGTSSAPSSTGINAWVANMGRYPQILGLFETNDWGAANGGNGFSASDLARFDPDSNTHAIPHLRWKPNTSISWRAIADGAADTRINNAAEACSRYPYKMFLTIEHEHDIETEVKDDPQNGRYAPLPGWEPDDFNEMWQRIHGMFATAGTTNVVWVLVYSGNSYQTRSGSNPVGSRFSDYYPGDAYVDWIAWDPYTRDSTTSSYANLMTENKNNTPGWNGFYSWAQAFRPNKPLMLAETGVGITPGSNNELLGMSDPQRAATFQTYLTQVFNYPAIKAYEYWHQVLSSDFQLCVNGGVTPQRTSNPPSLADFINFQNCGYFENDALLAKFA